MVNVYHCKSPHLLCFHCLQASLELDGSSANTQTKTLVIFTTMLLVCRTHRHGIPPVDSANYPSFLISTLGLALFTDDWSVDSHHKSSFHCQLANNLFPIARKESFFHLVDNDWFGGRVINHLIQNKPVDGVFFQNKLRQHSPLKACLPNKKQSQKQIITFFSTIYLLI